MIASRDAVRSVCRATPRPSSRGIPTVLVPAIVESCRIKADVVSKDEREGGLRRILNFGHTIGHALEAVTQYRRFRHGEAIAYGMLGGRRSRRRARRAARKPTAQALAALIAKLGPLPSIADLSSADIIEAVRRDKKVVERDAALRPCHRDRRDGDGRRRDRGGTSRRAGAIGDPGQYARRSRRRAVRLGDRRAPSASAAAPCSRRAHSAARCLLPAASFIACSIFRRSTSRSRGAAPRPASRTGRSAPTDSRRRAPATRNDRFRWRVWIVSPSQQDDRPLDAVLQLADVAGPRVRAQLVERRWRQRQRGLFRSRQNLSTKCRARISDVVAALAQRRDRDREDRQPEVEVLAELPLGHRAASGRGWSRRRRARRPCSDCVPPTRSKLLLLEHAQQLGLQRERQLADLVEEQRAAVRQLEASRLARGRAGEGALLVAEQLALEQRARESPRS